jgi:DNA-directed RNA polymerase subunit RPC12/RpoP
MAGERNPIRCPNCGGYKTEEEGLVTLMDAGLILITAGLWFVIIIFRMINRYQNPVQKGDKLVCNLCGYKWAWPG